MNYGFNTQLRDNKHEDVKYDTKSRKYEKGGLKKCRSFGICLNLDDYQFKISQYIGQYI